MRDKVPGDFLSPVDDFCCGAMRPEHPLTATGGLCPESSVPVIADCTYPYPTCGRARAFDDFFPEAGFFSLVHNSSPSVEYLVGSYPPPGNAGFRRGKAVGLYDIEFISYDPAILEIIEG